MDPRLSVVFRRLVRLGSFPACWRQANVTSIPKGPPPSSVANYRQISITFVLFKVFERLVSVRLGRFMERNGVLPTTQFAYRKGLRTCDALWACRIHWKVYWRVGRRPGSCRLISAQSLIGSTIRAFSISSVPWVLEVLCGRYWHSFYQIDHSTLWWTLVGVNWLTSYQECRRSVFCARYCSSCAHWSFFPFWRISWSVMPMTPLHFNCCSAIPTS